MEIGRKIIHLDSVDSTNNYVAKLLQGDEIDHGTVILASEQYAGKGQRSSEWVVKPGENLTFSVFLDNVNVAVGKQFILTQIVSLSLVALLKKRNLKAEIKWPNDIFVNGKKIAGVLIENQLRSTTIQRTIIGVGLNVNEIDFKNFTATSIKNEQGAFVPLNDVLYSFIDLFNKTWSTFISDLSLLDQQYHNNLYLRNVSAKYQDQLGVFNGLLLGVEPSGKLLIEREGVLASYDLKEIKFISQNAL